MWKAFSASAERPILPSSQPRWPIRVTFPGSRAMTRSRCASDAAGTPSVSRAAIDSTVDTRIFKPRAAVALAHYSAGVPRLINVMANKCLLLAYGEDTQRVTVDHVHLAAKDTPGVVARRPWWLWLRPALDLRRAPARRKDAP